MSDSSYRVVCQPQLTLHRPMHGYKGIMWGTRKQAELDLSEKGTALQGRLCWSWSLLLSPVIFLHLDIMAIT